MTVYEIVKASESLMKVMEANKIAPHYARHIEIYEQYMRMKKEGHKMLYAMQWICETYNTTESTIKRIVQRFSKQIK